jgi:hypothetical protein
MKRRLMLRKRLQRDDHGRLYVDVFLLSHPDKDHCTGFTNHFHLGKPEEWSKEADKIFIREIWSSPMVFRRASRTHVLCNDAMAFNEEARRRVRHFRASGGFVMDGDRILILGKDEDGKTDDLGTILVEVDTVFSRVNGQNDPSFSALLLAPQPKNDDELEEETRAKNHSSTILNISLAGDGIVAKGRFLTGGDAGVAIWERIWNRYAQQPDSLEYVFLLATHHCSWHSLSYDSWSDLGEEAKVCGSARKALSQTRHGAAIIASSRPIEDDDNDPPCVRAKREYLDIAANAGGSFRCVGDAAEILEYEIGRNGPRRKTPLMQAPTVFGSGAVGSQPLPHG